jgi:hypothetical protein
MPLPAVLPGTYGDSAGGYILRPFVVELSLNQSTYRLGLVLQESDPVMSRREHGFYRRLAAHLPIIVPGFVIGDDTGWLVLEGLSDLCPPEKWNVDDYREAVDNLAILHDRFWGLEEDLDNFMCLWRPLDVDYPDVQVTIHDAAHKLIDTPSHPLLDTPRHKATFEHLSAQLDQIKDPLLQQPLTLTHGSYWAGNIARPLDGRQIITHWQYAAIAPVILDVVMFYQSTLSHLKPAMAIEAAIERYRAQLAQRQGKAHWTDSQWEMLWDYALMWLFAIHWLPRLAEMPPEKYEPIHERVQERWIVPVQQAMEKQLGVILPEQNK